MLSNLPLLRYEFIIQTAPFRTAAKVSHTKYGTRSHTAVSSTRQNIQIVAATSTHSRISQINANPKTCRLKKNRGQKKLTTNCAINKFSPQLRAFDGSARLTRAALIPINANRIVHTTGNTHDGGVNIGFETVAL